MATRRNGPGGLFHSLEGLPLFDPNGPVRRYGARGHDMLAAVPPLYMAAALLVLLFTSVGLMTSLAAANGQVAEMSAVLSGLQEQLGLHAEADAEATNYREALQASPVSATRDSLPRASVLRRSPPTTGSCWAPAYLHPITDHSAF